MTFLTWLQLVKVFFYFMLSAIEGMPSAVPENMSSPSVTSVSNVKKKRIKVVFPLFADQEIFRIKTS